MTWFNRSFSEYSKNIGLTEALEQLGVAVVLAETSCKFIRPVYFSEIVLISGALIFRDQKKIVIEGKIISIGIYVLPLDLLFLFFFFF